GVGGGGGGGGGGARVAVGTAGAGWVVYGVGNDWDAALARVLGPNQIMVHQRVDTVAGDTFWVQALGAPVAAAGTVVAVSDTGPTADRWNLAAVEIVPSGTVPPPELTISNVLATDRTASSTTIRWTTNVAASSRVDYGLDARYGLVATSALLVTDHSVPLMGLSAATTYHYRVTSQDGQGRTATTGDFVFTTAELSVITCSI